MTLLSGDLKFVYYLCLEHRVGRVLSFSPIVGIGTPPTPHPQASVPPPPLVPGVEGALAGGRVPNSDEGTYTVVLFIYMYSVVQSLPLDGDVKESVWKGRVCFLCMRTKFGLFSRGQKCDMCKQIVCARCFTKVLIRQLYGFQILTALIKKKIKFSSYIRKFRVEQLQSHK